MPIQWKKINYLHRKFSVSNQRRYTRTKLQEDFEAYFDEVLPDRTFYEYIRVLRDKLKAPIESERVGKQMEYFYEKKFELPHSPLTHEDTQTLKSIGSLLDVLPDLPHIQELRAIVSALEDQVALKSDEVAPTFFLEQRPAATGTKYLSDLDKHIQKKNVLNISYLPFKNPDGSPSDTPIQRIIHPYFLKEYQRYWYLFGWSEDLQQVVNYALGRIQKIEIVRECSLIPNSFDPKSYFDDIIGVTKLENQGVEVYKIRVNDQIAPYWRSRPLHHSQQVLNDHVFQFKLRWNYEWQNWILYYGKNVEVLEPKWFRDSIQQILSIAAKQYENEVVRNSR